MQFARSVRVRTSSRQQGRAREEQAAKVFVQTQIWALQKERRPLCSNSSPAQTVNSSELMINMLRYIREQNIIFCADKNVLFFPERKIHYPQTGNKQNTLDIFQLFVISPVLFVAIIHYPLSCEGVAILWESQDRTRWSWKWSPFILTITNEIERTASGSSPTGEQSKRVNQCVELAAGSEWSLNGHFSLLALYMICLSMHSVYNLHTGHKQNVLKSIMVYKSN